jgi:hypothetical protein
VDDTGFMKKVDKGLKRFANETRYNYIQHLYKEYYQQLAPKQVSPITHILSTHWAYVDYCRATYANSELDPHTCALVYSFAQHHETYDNFWFTPKPGEKQFNAEFVYWGMTDDLNPKFH